MHRALCAIDPERLEDALDARPPAPNTLPLDPPVAREPEPTLCGQEADGKALRGLGAHGAAVPLVSLVQHDDACVLARTAVARKSSEITAVPRLLGGRVLLATVTTIDALFTQHHITHHILKQGRQYLMVVNTIQPELFLAVELLFAYSPWA